MRWITLTLLSVTLYGQTARPSNIVTTDSTKTNTLVGQTIVTGLDTATQYASQYSGADASCKINAAIAGLPAAGGTVDARDLTDVGGSGACTIDAGTKYVTVLLGPTTYFVTQIVLEPEFRLIGMGSTNGLGPVTQATLLQAKGGNSTPVFVLVQNTAAQGVVLRGFQMIGTAGNTTETAFNLIAPTNGGLWYSEFDDIQVSGFGGFGLNLDGQNNGPPGGLNQFDTFKRIVILRPSGGNFALQLIGRNNSLKFENCQFDGPFQTVNNGTNISITQGTTTIFPSYNIKFDLLTSQWANVCMSLAGADSVSVDQGHFEGCQGVATVTSGSSFGTLNFTIHDSGFFTSSGIGTIAPGLGVGNGYIINHPGATGNDSIAIIDSHSLATPDNFLLGNKQSIVSYGNVIGPEGSYSYQPLQTGGPYGFGAGSSGTAVTTTTKGGGTGPTTPQTIVQYQQILVNGAIFWIPLVQ